MLAEDLKERGGLDLSECFVDGTFAGAKKGRIGGKTKQARVRSPLSWSTALVFLSPYAQRALLCTKSRSKGGPATSFVRERPERLIGERTYDSDPLDAALQEKSVIEKA